MGRGEGVGDHVGWWEGGFDRVARLGEGVGLSTAGDKINFCVTRLGGSRGAKGWD